MKSTNLAYPNANSYFSWRNLSWKGICPASPSLSPQFVVTFLFTLLSLLQIDVTPRRKVGLLWFFDEVIEGINSSVDALSFFAHCRFFACCHHSLLNLGRMLLLCSLSLFFALSLFFFACCHLGLWFDMIVSAWPLILCSFSCFFALLLVACGSSHNGIVLHSKLSVDEPNWTGDQPVDLLLPCVATLGLEELLLDLLSSLTWNKLVGLINWMILEVSDSIINTATAIAKTMKA